MPFERLIFDLHYDSFSAVMRVVELLKELSIQSLARKDRAMLELIFKTLKDWLKTINNLASKQDLLPIVSLTLHRASQEVKNLIVMTEQKLKKVAR